jgi:5'-nucleotidase/UDP-sugar diphosphatase
MKPGTFIFFILIIVVTGVLHADDYRKIYIFYTNDIHGAITEEEADFLNPEFPPLLGGGAAAANIIFSYRKKAKDNDDIVLVLDAGDIFQGTPIGTKTAGKAIIDYMNRVGYDAGAAGNHDFDLGKDVFVDLTRRANFPILSANLIDKETGGVFKAVKPYTIIEKKGVRIGIFGITTEATENMSFPKNITGLDFSAEAPAAQRAVNALREKGVDLVIALVHMGLPYDTEEGYRAMKSDEANGKIKVSYLNAMEMAHYVSGIDLLFGGHLHLGYQEPWEDPVNHTLCFQNYGNGGNLGLVEIKIDRRSKTIAGYELPGRNGSLLLLTLDEFWPDSNIYADIKNEQAEVEKGYDEVIGVSKVDLNRSGEGESTMNNLICDAMIQATGADFSLTNFGGIRADLRAGPITRRDLFQVLPFGNSLVVMQMTGEFLKQVVESKISTGRSGLAIGGGMIEFDQNRPDGNKITFFMVGEHPLYPKKEYRLVTTDYLAEGNSGLDLLLQVDEANVAHTGILLRDAVSEYISTHNPLEIKTDGRWKKR